MTAIEWLNDFDAPDDVQDAREYAENFAKFFSPATTLQEGDWYAMYYAFLEERAYDD